MIKKQHIDLRFVGMGLCGVSLCVAFLSFIVTFKGLGFGLWPQSEAPMVVLHVSAVLASAGLIFLMLSLRRFFRFFYNPIVVLPLALGILSVFILPFQDFPIRHFVGAPRSGEGVVWWLDVAVLSASALFLFRFKVWRYIISFLALLAFLLPYLVWMAQKFHPHGFTSYDFSDYMAFHLLALLPFICILLTKRLRGWQAFVVGYVLFNTLLFYTDNNSMIIFGFTVPLLLGALWLLEGRSPIVSRKFSACGVVAIPIFIFVLLIVLSQLISDYQGYFLEHAGSLWTVISRAYLADMSLKALVEVPVKFVVGDGWGSFGENQVRFQPSDWFDFNNEIKRWDGFMHDHFHSHNMFVEALSSAGLLGFVLFSLYLSCFIFWVKTGFQKIAFVQGAGLMMWASTWFLLPVHLPYLVFLGLYTVKRKPLSFLNRYDSVFKFILLLVLVLQVIAVVMCFKTALVTNRFESDALSGEQALNNCPITYYDFGAGGLHLSRMMLDRLRYTIGYEESLKSGSLSSKKDFREDSGESVEFHIQSMNHLFCQSTRYAQEFMPSQRLQVARLLMRAEILFGLSDYLDEDTRHLYDGGWRDDLNVFLVSNPERVDQATPYLLYNLAQGKEEESIPILRLLEQNDPNNPVFLWFQGLLNLKIPDRVQEGVIQMQRAMSNGIERFVPVDEGTRAMLGR